MSWTNFLPQNKSSLFKESFRARLAQSVERWTFNPTVVGSSPTSGVAFDLLSKFLVSTTSGDYTTQTMELTAEFTRRFGEQTPIWFIGSLDEAAKEAYGAQTKTIDRKMLGLRLKHS